MQITSHIKIANYIYDRIDRNEKRNINRFMFILGSIAPDLKIARHPKFKIYNDSIELIESKMIDIEELGKNKFSYRLGIIVHYITDYFCLAHNLKNTLKTRTHLLYEFRLARAMKKYIATHEFGKQLQKDSLDLIKEHSDIITMIAHQHKVYVEERSDNFIDQMVLDIQASMSLCMALALFILK